MPAIESPTPIDATAHHRLLHHLPSLPRSCRHANRLQLHPKYNCWEVAAPEGDRVDMNHEGRINRAEGEAGLGAPGTPGHGDGSVELGVRDRCLCFGGADAEAGGVCWCCHENGSTSLLVQCVGPTACEAKRQAKHPVPAARLQCPLNRPTLLLLLRICPPAAGVDYYRTQLVVPKDAYELNFVFSNGDGLYDNNGNQVGRAGGWRRGGSL